MHHPGAQEDAEDDQGDRVEGVVKGDEGDHPPRDVVAPHARLSQRPVGEDDAAGPPAEKSRVAATPAMLIS